MIPTVKIKPVIVYEITTEGGTLLGEFQKTSEWNGITKYEDSYGNVLLCESREIVGRILGMMTDNQKAYSTAVYKASPTLGATIAEECESDGKHDSSNPEGVSQRCDGPEAR